MIVETDITYNNNVTWTTNGNNYDTESVAAHEVGHALGIHHTNLTGGTTPTMNAFYFGTGGRSLASDDVRLCSAPRAGTRPHLSLCRGAACCAPTTVPLRAQINR